MKTLKTSNLCPKRGTIADLKRQRAFENREITIWQAIAEGVTFAVMFVLFIIAFAVM